VNAIAGLKAVDAFRLDDDRLFGNQCFERRLVPKITGEKCLIGIDN